MKIDGINVTVRIDVECPDNMGAFRGGTTGKRNELQFFAYD